ncbi:origin recognition complex subunit 4 [Stomoxys calcitrans]|uniref:Origin recognition complex subunit 4 n=1 Tax=Stomoxys calcitrans TaxID=35570 RepID=A0A1I8NVM2_STOCA|nr:origin recognition complex subunit 4 [Stomoxys calcitrans]
MPDDSEEILKTRKFLKARLLRDYSTFRGHENEHDNIRQLLKRTAEMGESNSMLLIGPRGSGKTTLMNAVLTDLMKNKDFVQNTLIVYLNGNLHTDDRLALKSVTIQMQLENATDGKVFGSFAENLAFLLACLKAGNKRSKSVVFILDEFDLFCSHHNQTLLYNLFDVSQSAQAPICVLGITCRLDVIELLEKRVKSRFSHRQVFIFPNGEDFDAYIKLFGELLSIPSEKQLKEQSERVAGLKHLQSNELTFHRNHFQPSKYKFHKKYTESWNKHIAGLVKNASVTKALQAVFDFDISQAFLKSFIYRLVAHINNAAPMSAQITAESISQLAASYEIDDKVELLCGLSVLELCLVIAIKHHSEIYDRDPFNFEIIFSRFNKFAKVSSTMQGIERPVALKAFEHLRNMELLLPLTATTCKVQKEFEMHKMALTYTQINQTVQRYQALPTEVQQWSQSSII